MPQVIPTVNKANQPHSYRRNEACPFAALRLQGMVFKVLAANLLCRDLADPGVDRPAAKAKVEMGRRGMLLPVRTTKPFTSSQLIVGTRRAQVIPTVGTRRTNFIPTVGTRSAPSHSYRRNKANQLHSYRRNVACPKSFLP